MDAAVHFLLIAVFGLLAGPSAMAGAPGMATPQAGLPLAKYQATDADTFDLLTHTHPLMHAAI